MAPKKKVKPSEPNPDDTLLFAQRSQWLSDNIKANAANSKILNDLLMPALTYLKNLDIFKDWNAPQPLQLKTQDEKENGQLGAFMAPFDKKELHAFSAEQRQVHLCDSTAAPQFAVQPDTRRAPVQRAD